MIDYSHVELRNSWGGPFNGQKGRQALAQDIISNFAPEIILETGTYRGTTTKHLSEIYRGPIYTIEANARNFGFSICQLFGRKNVHCKLGDSRTWLTEIGKHLREKSRVFAYLDAHWNADLPLKEEITIVQSMWSSSLIMIDDFQVLGDEGYGYDSYGKEAELTLDYIRPALTEDSVIFFPNLPSRDESGHRRGCVVIARGGGVEIASNLQHLRRASLESQSAK